MANPKPTVVTSAKANANGEPVPVIVVENPNDNKTPFRLYAILIFLGTLLGSLIGAVADLGQAADTVQRIGEIFDPLPQVCVVGSDTILGGNLGLAQAWQTQFIADRRVKVSIEATGSIRGLERVKEGGCVDVLAMSEAMTAQQFNELQDAGVTVQCAAEIGYDVIAFVTDINNRLPTLEQRNLAAILTGRYKNWDDVRGADQTIYILARPGSGTTVHVLKQVGRILTEGNDFPPDANYVPCSSNEECLDLTLATSGSLYWVSTAWMRTKPERYLRVLPILSGDERPINPLTDENFSLDQYPSALVRPLYMYVLKHSNSDPEALQYAEAFLAYIRSVRGQQTLEQYKFITYFDSTADIPIILPQGFNSQSSVRQICKPSAS